MSFLVIFDIFFDVILYRRKNERFSCDYK